MFKMILYFLTILFVSASSLRHKTRDKYGLLGEPPMLKNKVLPEDEWFSQMLDHFDPTNENVWMQRYFTSTDYFKDGGPIFLMIGGEGEASPVWMTNGAWLDYASTYGALCFQLEHRYYGKSHPTNNMSVENMKYLSSEQALADIAYFIRGMNNKYNLPKGTKWIAFGGSYPGNLAAWVRSKYPHLVHGAMSASGPLLAKIDFQEYFQVVTDSLATYGNNCVSAVKGANNQLEKLLKHPVGQKSIFKKFKLCSPLKINVKKDIANLFEVLADNFAGVVQYNKDNRGFKKSPGWNITIDTVCDIMTNETIGIYIDRYAAVNQLLMDTYNQTCVDYKYKDMINLLKNESWDSAASEGGRQWMYQTCTEFGYYQTSSKKNVLFGDNFPINFFIDQCSDIFGNEFDKGLLLKGVKRTNTLYGGLDIEESRVVYVHGSIDPWHALGILSSNSTSAPAIYIEGTAHCANMYPASDQDLPQLTDARKRISSLIGQWLAE
uniref:Serine protease K12H4.7 n=1 Tax=Clastoptera arizonana TaxID=38151 RepID=A0A1B6CAA8_9HEMI